MKHTKHKKILVLPYKLPGLTLDRTTYNVVLNSSYTWHDNNLLHKTFIVNLVHLIITISSMDIRKTKDRRSRK